MKFYRSSGLIVAVVALSCFSRADFKYTQQSKMTGGALMGMTKALGVFSKSARQANQAQLSSIMVKGNKMRDEKATGEVEIIDLDGRRFIHVDPAKKTYSIVTFDEFKASMQRAQERAKEERAKQTAKNPDAQNVKMTPKFDAQVTGATRNILGLTANEMKMNMSMEVQSDDPKAQQQAQAGAFTINSDSWMAEVPGYDELHQFHTRMAKELDWFPGTMMGTMNMGTPQMGPAMEEFKKNAAKVKGMPLVQTMDIGTAATGAPQGQAGQTPQPANQTPPPSQTQPQTPDNSTPTNARDALTKGLGGVFGGFGKKKKQDQQPAQPTDQSSTASPSSQPATNSSSLMQMTVEVTNFSSDPLDKELFDVPAGYAQVPGNPDAEFGKAH
jgi:hypothetical protein